MQQTQNEFVYVYLLCNTRKDCLILLQEMKWLLILPSKIRISGIKPARLWCGVDDKKFSIVQSEPGWAAPRARVRSFLSQLCGNSAQSKLLIDLAPLVIATGQFFMDCSPSVNNMLKIIQQDHRHKNFCLTKKHHK